MKSLRKRKTSLRVTLIKDQITSSREICQLHLKIGIIIVISLKIMFLQSHCDLPVCILTV